MSLCKSLSAFQVLLGASALVLPLHANMRAPVHVEHGSSELEGTRADLRVLSEKLEFRCPESYTGKADFKAFAVRVCRVRAVYRLSATAAGQVKLVFVFAGGGEVVWKYGGKSYRSKPSAMKSTAKKVCTYCPDDLKKVNSTEQAVDIVVGSSEIEVNYDQALSYDESGHGYFSDGAWWQGFTYELWPIAEWQWAADFHAELIFSIAARSGFLGIGHKDDKMECRIEENGKNSPVSLRVSRATEGRRDATARIELKKGPQRLHCSYAAD